LRASVNAEVKYGKSVINVTISLDAITASLRPNSRSLFTFDAVVDWHERHEFLKFELPLNIHSDNATYETQFGHVQRPTHKNTTWDAAKFEVCGHKYADLSEFGYGVAFLSESKYGFACEGNVLRISLLRAATAPDAEQDQGKHAFSWAVMPHLGHFFESDVPVAAYIFNSPLHVRYIPSNARAPLLPTLKTPFEVHGASNVFLETVKRGDDDKYRLQDSEETVILRLYEAYGGHGQATLKVASHISVREAYVTNLLEDEGDQLNILRADDTEHTAAVLKLDFRGFEVKTVKLVIGTKRSYSAPQGKRESWVTVDKARLF
jgi:alpha-mannosidase